MKALIISPADQPFTNKKHDTQNSHAPEPQSEMHR